MGQVSRGDTVKRAALAGVVRDTLGRPLHLATILVVGKDLSAISDDSGRFHIAGIPAGESEFMVMRIGHRSVSFAATLLPDTTVIVGIRLTPVQVLEELEVTARRRTDWTRTGFEERQRIGLGKFVTPDRIERLSPVGAPSTYLRDISGIDVRCISAGRCSVVPRYARCLWLWVDGVLYRDAQLDDILSATQVYAIEVYSRESSVPMEFQGMLPRKSGREMTQFAGCGALVVWTKANAP